MTNGTAPPPAGFAARLAAARSGRVYLFGVTALAVLVIVLACTAQFKRSETTEATIAVGELGVAVGEAGNSEADANRIRQSAAEQLNSRLASTSLLKQIVWPVEDRDGPPREQLIAHFQQHLKIVLPRRKANTPQASAPPTGPQLSVLYSGRSPQGARVVNQFVERCIAEHNDKLRKGARAAYQTALQQAHRTKATMDKANAELDRFVREHFSTIAAANKKNGAEAAPQGAAVSRGPAAGEENREHPEVARLRHQLEQLEAQRSAALERLTPAHPIVESLDSRLTQVWTQLRQVEEKYESPPPASQAPPARPKFKPKPKPLVSAERKRYERLQAQAEQALREFQQASLQTQAAQAELQQVSGRLWKVTRWAEHDRERGTPAATLLVALLLAVVCGGALCAFGMPEDNRLWAAGDAQDAFSLPILGVVPAAADAPAAQPLPLPGPTAMLRRAAELVLVFSMLLVLLAIVVDGSLLAEAAAQPHSLVPRSLERLWEALSG